MEDKEEKKKEKDEEEDEKKKKEEDEEEEEEEGKEKKGDDDDDNNNNNNNNIIKLHLPDFGFDQVGGYRSFGRKYILCLQGERHLLISHFLLAWFGFIN